MTVNTSDMPLLTGINAKRYPEEEKCETKKNKASNPGNPTVLVFDNGSSNLITKRTMIDNCRAT